ncbi:LuxR C-terminal-related transcriptional regulator [Flammeovirgaceae bacterium SG7u.111]|nr:LuxR C-terminal-related transcriptional regulator [Flammeovirgaceae bacterium SG7u.132]WPO33327.1 LuxR C-terminal-related transcriptional regulator [Flammeovirgaceae bacterium SG7u.111]
MGKFDHYNEIFRTTYDFRKEEIKGHIKHLKELDKVLPPSSTFLMITNTSISKYEFISKNFGFATGQDKEEFLEKGIPHFLSFIHPDEIQTWLQLLRELVEFYLENYPPQLLDRLDFQYNYRFKNAEGNYVNILENQVNILADTNGRPIVGLGHFTVFGEGEELPMRATVRFLNEHDDYETVFYKVYNTGKIRLLESVITKRERDILRLIAMGHPNGLIAHKLGISVHTVQTHRKNMLEKTESKNSTELVVQAIREGLI